MEGSGKSEMGVSSTTPAVEEEEEPSMVCNPPPPFVLGAPPPTLMINSTDALGWARWVVASLMVLLILFSTLADSASSFLTAKKLLQSEHSRTTGSLEREVKKDPSS